MNHLPKILLLFLLLGTAIACKKSDDTPANQPDYTATAKVTESESVMQDALYATDDAFDGNDDGMTGGKIAGCAIITHDEPTKTVVVDFGTGCTGIGGRTRSGKVTVVYEGTRAVSSKRTMTFANYTAKSGSSSYSLSGTITSSFSYSSAGYTYTLSASNLSVTLSSGTKLSVTTLSRVIVFAWGGDKKNPAGYTTSITGTSSNTDDTGKTTTVTIDPANPILIKGSCVSSGIYYPASGVYDILDGKIKYTVTWGSGACDKDIQITALGQTVTKTLP